MKNQASSPKTASKHEGLANALRKCAAGCAALALSLGALLHCEPEAQAADFVVYGMYRPLDLGNPGETPQKDYYINMGSRHGVHVGDTLEVLRRVSTYDLQTEKLYADILFPFAKVKVIHVENGVAVARMDKINPAEKTPGSPIASNRGIMIGDFVRPAGR